MLDEEKPDKFDVAYGAQKMALRLTIQALVDHASKTDPQLRDRVLAAVEASLTRLSPQSELERDFADRARADAAAMLRPPSR